MMREYKNVYPELYKELSDDVKGYYSFDYSTSVSYTHLDVYKRQV